MSQFVTCSKKYSDIPFAHRQHNHDGHCAWIHGHNWGIEIEFQASSLDINNFVVDFGKLKFIKRWIDENLDHALLINESDPEREYILSVLQFSDIQLAKILVVPDGSAEGLAEWLWSVFDVMVRRETDGRAWIRRLSVYEDGKNSATFMPGGFL